MAVFGKAQQWPLSLKPTFQSEANVRENTQVLRLRLFSGAAGKKWLGFRLAFFPPAGKCKSAISGLAISAGNVVGARLWDWKTQNILVTVCSSLTGKAQRMKSAVWGTCFCWVSSHLQACRDHVSSDMDLDPRSPLRRMPSEIDCFSVIEKCFGTPFFSLPG